MPMLSVRTCIEAHWQHPKWWLTIGLWPLSRLFQTISALRRGWYRWGWQKTQRLPCPVVVVGNLHVGGVGKTPLVASLAEALRTRGILVGIISRGYGRQSHDTLLLKEGSRPEEVGDEPLMLWRQTGVPVAVGDKRYDAGMLLLQAHPEIQLIICDDGLQHYALAREMELVVFPAADVGRAIDVLPNGPLREPLGRLAGVDALLLSQGDDDAVARARQLFRLPETVYCAATQIQPEVVYALNAPKRVLYPKDCEGQTVAAVAGIGRPDRFFNTLRSLGWPLGETKVLPDHAQIQAADLPAADVVLVTEKDAVKLAGQDLPHVWVLKIMVSLPPILLDKIEQRCC